MNATDRRIIIEFPDALDKAVNDKFGAKTECESIFDLLGSMNMVTHFKGKGQKRKEIGLFINGFMAGNKELSDRLTNKN